MLQYFNDMLLQIIMTLFLKLLFVSSSHWFLAVICFPGLDGPKQVNLDSESFSWSEILASSGKPAPKLRKMRFEVCFNKLLSLFYFYYYY